MALLSAPIMPNAVWKNAYRTRRSRLVRSMTWRSDSIFDEPCGGLSESSGGRKFLSKRVTKICKKMMDAMPAQTLQQRKNAHC